MENKSYLPPRSLWGQFGANFLSSPIDRRTAPAFARKGDIEQRGGGGECHACSDLRQQQERSDGPELVERQNEGKQAAEGHADFAEIESYGGQQVEAQRDSCRACHEDRAHNGQRSPAGKEFAGDAVGIAQVSKTADVEDEYIT